jgi:hypothetical protein
MMGMFSADRHIFSRVLINFTERIVTAPDDAELRINLIKLMEVFFTEIIEKQGGSALAIAVVWHLLEMNEYDLPAKIHISCAQLLTIVTTAVFKSADVRSDKDLRKELEKTTIAWLKAPSAQL